MGQYYKSVCIDAQQHITCYDYGSGAKLMEHSWMTNDYMMALEGMFTPGGNWFEKRYVHCGDYMDSDIFIKDEHKEEIKSLKNYYSTHDYWRRRIEAGEIKIKDIEISLYDLAEYKFTKIKPAFVDLDAEGFHFICNDDKRQYVDKREVKEFWPYWDKKTKGQKGKGWRIHPLPLLTCSGNGRGGGDYRGPYQKEVGIWAGDRISVRKLPPKGYRKRKSKFRE